MTIFYEVVSFITGRYKGFKIKVFDNDRMVDDGYPPNGSENRTDFDMVPNSDNASDWLRASELTHLLRERATGVRTGSATTGRGL